MTVSPAAEISPLDRARKKAYWRLLPILFLAYVIAFVDRANVAFAKLTMVKDIPGFDNAVIGLGAGIFFIGYFLLEIPGSVIVERWSARLWIFRIMVTWGLVAALTAFVGVPLGVSEWVVTFINTTFNAKLGVPEFQFYAARFLLGLAEAGFFPGVVVFLSHWFPSRDRARALALFFMATPVAQIIAPPICALMLKIGTTEMINGVAVHHPEVLGLKGWQWIYISWGVPAVVLGFVILWMLPDKPRHARWLRPEEREALEAELLRNNPKAKVHVSLWQGLRHPKVVALSLAYFCTVTGSYGVVFFLPSILDRWYQLKYSELAWLTTLPAITALVGQLFVGWNSDRTKERRMHAAVPIYLGALALALTLASRGDLWLTIALFTVAMTGLKAYLPAFWSLPSLFLTEAAAAGSIGLINSVGNLGGQLGPFVLGKVEAVTGSFEGGILFLAASMAVSASLVLALGLGRSARTAAPEPTPFAEPSTEPA
jgi:ACS family tartrate transporter-like MFS transporter